MTFVETIHKTVQEISPEEHQRRVASIRAALRVLGRCCCVAITGVCIVAGFYTGYKVADKASNAYQYYPQD